MSKKKQNKDQPKKRTIPKVRFMNVAIKDNMGRVARSIDIPTSLEYIDLSKYCDFLSWVLRIDKWVGDQEKDGTFNPFDIQTMKAYISQMARAIEAFGIIDDQDELEYVPLGDYDEHLKQFLKVENPDMINLDQTQETLLHIYHNLFVVCQKYEPRIFQEDLVFEYRGKEFKIPKLKKDRLTRKELSPEISTQEAIEVLDLQGRVHRDKRSADFDSDLMFTQYLEQMAILATEVGTQIPGDDVQFSQYVERMKIFFSGGAMNGLPQTEPISAALAIDIDFFLSMQLGLLNKTLKHAIFSTSNIQLQGTARKVN